MNNKVNHQNLLNGLLMLLAILFVMPQGALAQTKYTIQTDGNCEVYYYYEWVTVVVTEAEAGQELSVRVKESANPGNGKYFTGEFTMNGTSLGSNEWGYNEGFTMPAENVTIAAVKADKQTLSFDLKTTTQLEVPSAAALLFNGDDRLNYKDELEGYDVDNSGVADMVYTTSEDGMHMYVQRLAGSDASGTFSLTYSEPTYQYSTISFIFPEKKKIQVQSSWITLSGTEFTYTGQTIEPTVTVMDGTKDITQQFDISYNNNLSAGEATVTVTAKATSTSYTGSVSKTFTITPKKVTISGVKAKDKIYDGTTSAVIDAESAIIDGKVEGDVLTVNAQSVIAVFADAEAGKDKPVTVSGFTLAGDQAGNYTLSAQPTSVTGTIVPKPVTVESGLTVSSTTLKEITGYSVDATNVKIVGAVNNEKLSIMGVIARLQNGSMICDLDYTTATIVIGVDKANNYVLAQQGNQATAEITASTETVTNEDGSTIETATTRVKNADGSITETIKKKVTNLDGSVVTEKETTIYADGSKAVKETVTNDADGSKAVKETVTNADGSMTVKETVTNADGKEAVKETVKDADGSVKETVTDFDGSMTVKETVTDKDGKVIQTTETIKKKVTNPDGIETTTENTKETVTNPDGSITETIKETVTDKDGKVIQTTETIKKKVTNPDGTETTTENAKETVTNPDGTETTTENTKETVTDKDGKVLQTTEAITTTATGADGSQTITTSKTPETDANEIYSIAADGKGTVTSGNGGGGTPTGLYNRIILEIQKICDALIKNAFPIDASSQLLISGDDAPNILVNTTTKKNVEGNTEAPSASITIKQNRSADASGDVNTNKSTKIAVGNNLGKYMFHVNISGHGTLSVSPASANMGDWVTITVNPDNGYKLEKLYVMDAGDYNNETNGIRPTQSPSDPNQYTFQIPFTEGWTASSTGLNINASFVADGTGGGGTVSGGTGGGGGGAVSGGTGGGGSAIVNGGENKAATTVTINYQTKKETDGGVVTGDVYGVNSKVTVANNSVAMIGGTVDKIIGGGTRGATAEQEDDEIEIVSGKEYKILRDGYIVLNFYTPDADITVNSIVFRRPGDANNDGYVNAVDLVEMINAKNGNASERFNLANADIDRDGQITQDDIDAVVKLIMEQTDEK